MARPKKQQPEAPGKSEKSEKKAAPQKGAANSQNKAPQTLDEVAAMIHQKYGSVIRGDEDLHKEVTSWGSFALDYITGGGIIAARVTEIFGGESAGKSTLALLCAEQFIKRGAGVFWIDLENNWDKRTKFWAMKLGVDVSKIKVSKPTTGEAALNSLRLVAESGVDCLVVFDSWAAVVSNMELEASAGDSVVGRNAMMCNMAIRQIQSALNKLTCQTAVLVINQMRDTIGGPTKTTTPGGRGIRFSAGVRIQISRMGWLNQQVDGQQMTVGQDVGLKTVKNKTYPPYQTCETVLYVRHNKYGKIGFDNIRDRIRYGSIWKIVRNLPESAKGKKDGGLHFVDENGEFIRLGTDENRAVAQLCKPDNTDLLQRFCAAVDAEAKKRIEATIGVFEQEGATISEGEDDDYAEEGAGSDGISEQGDGE